MNSEFSAVLGGILSPDNNERARSEGAFRAFKQQDPNQCIRLLVEGLQPGSGLAVEQRQLSTILLRRTILSEDGYDDSEQSFWDRLSPQTQAGVLGGLLICLESESTPLVLKKLYSVISDLASFLFERSTDWPQLLPTLFKMAGNAQSDVQRRSAFEAFSQLAVGLGAEVFRPMLASVMSMLQAGLRDAQDYKVRLSALSATLSFLQIMEQEDYNAFMQYRTLLPDMLECVTIPIKYGKEVEANASLELFIELAEVQPSFFEGELERIISTMLAIARGSDIPEETLRYATEMLITLTESRPEAMGKVPGYVPAVLDVLLKWMTENEEEDSEWENFEDENEMTNYTAGKEALDRLCVALGGAAVVPELFPRINVLLTSGDWKFRNAGLEAISICGEGCKDVLETKMGEIIGSIAKFVGDPSPRVRWAVYECVNQLCVDYSPLIQTAFGDAVAQIIVTGMKDPVTRVLTHAITCIISFSEETDDNIVAKYAPSFLLGLESTLGCPCLRVQETGICALSALATSLGSLFAPYYSKFVPFLKGIVHNAQAKETRQLRGRAFETLSIIGLAVGKEMFARDAVEILQEMKAPTSGDPDDPQTAFIEIAFGRFSEILGADFEQFLPFAVPSALEKASAKEEKEGWEIMNMGDKAIEIHTSQLEEKARAVRVLTCYASYVGAGFLPYLEGTLAAVLNNLMFFYNVEVRASSYKAIPHLLRVAVLSVKAGTATAPQLLELFSRIVAKLATTMLVEPNVDVKIASCAAFRRCFALIQHSCLTAEQLDKLASLFRTKLFTFVKQNNDGTDDDDGFYAVVCEDEDTKQKEAEYFTSLTDLICTIVKYHGDSFAPAYTQHLHQLFLSMVQPQQEPATIAHALTILAEITECCPSLVSCNSAVYMEGFITYAESAADRSVKSAGLRGIEAAAKAFGEKFAQYAQRALKVVCANLGSLECALSAMGSIIDAHPECVAPLQEGINSFLRLLPLTSDAAAARRAHHYLCSLVQKYPTQVLGESFEKAGSILTVLGKIVNTPNLSADDTQAVKTIVNALSSKVAPGSIPPEITAALQNFMMN